MSGISMRLETRAGTYTEVTGETNEVIDVSVVVGLGDDSGEFAFEDGRLTLPAEQGLALELIASSSGEIPLPTEDHLLQVEQGMFADNPLLDTGDIAGAVAEVAGNRDSSRVAYTFLGADAVRYAIAELEKLEGHRAARILGAAEYVLSRMPVSV